MITEAEDFRAESASLYALLSDASERDFAQPTLFKSWSVNQILRHLHAWNQAASASLSDPGRFVQYLSDLQSHMQAGKGMSGMELAFCDGAEGTALLELWQETYLSCADLFAGADPKQRVKWAGPDMSARSSITARQMETWAHGQAIFDRFGVRRIDFDRIRNIAHLGVNTFGWTFATRGQQPPGAPPTVRLTAPSGTIWEWHADSASGLIEGAATEFCQVVTQTRNILDTSLKVTGEVATLWMANAQCFAGGPEEPPAPGARHLQMGYTSSPS